MKKLSIAIALLILITGVLFAGGEKEKSEAGATGKHGGTLVAIWNSHPRHYNGAVQSGMATALVSTQVFASPLRYDADWNLKPYLAESWKISDDGLSVTLNLRKDVKFHDGEPLTSEDVAFTIGVIQENHPFKPMMAPVTGVDTPDPYTVIIRLSKPHPAILMALTPPLCPVLPKHVYGDGQELKNHPMNLKPIGSGPFKFVEHKQGEYIIMERNDDFFLEGKPYLDKFIIKIIEDPNNRMLMMEREEALYSFVEADAQSLLRFKELDNVEITNEGFSAIGSIEWICFNLRVKPLDDVRVRKAIAYALDRNFIVDELFKGFVTPCPGPIAPGSPFANPNVEQYELDIDKANALLDDAGYPIKSSGSRFDLTIDFEPHLRMRMMAEYIQSALKEVGIEVTLRPSADAPTWAKRIADWDFELNFDNLYNWGDPLIGVHRAYQCDNIKHQIWTNVGGYCNQRVEELMEKAGTEMDVQKRKEVYQEFCEIIVDELPVYPFYVSAFHQIYNKKVNNVLTSVWGPMAPHDEMYIEK